MVYVITACYNRLNITKKFIEILLSQTYKDICLILIDDGSTDGTAEMAKSLMPDSVVLTGDGNLWWGGALHKAYKWIKKQKLNLNDIIFISNDDVYFDKNYIENAVDLMKKNSDYLLAGNGVGSLDNKKVDGAFTYTFPKQSQKQLLDVPVSVGNCASTRSLFCTVKTFLNVGGFHPILLPHYLSDYEWTIRGAKKGHKVICYENLSYVVKQETTGYHELKWNKVFSKKSDSNPFYKINFTILAAPLGKKIISLFWQIGRFFKKVKEVK